MLVRSPRVTRIAEGSGEGVTGVVTESLQSHVRRGFSPGDSAVTRFQVWGNVWTEGLRDAWEEKVASMLAGIPKASPLLRPAR